MANSLMSTEAPVLLVVFNRPDTTQKVFEEIRKAKIKKLYIAADGPRIGHNTDRSSCLEVRNIFSKIDWDCEVITRFSDINQGCGPGPLNAISWVLQKEDRIIVLEDDCVPVQPFFTYCNELLERYKDDNRIWLISGNNYSEEAVSRPNSYLFSRYGHTQGWATWRRVWNEMDLEMKKFPNFVKQKMIFNSFTRRNEAKVFLNLYNGFFKDKRKLDHVWDVQFSFAIRINGGLTVVPSSNLVTNIGVVGTHSSEVSKTHFRNVNIHYKLESHPEFVLCDEIYDKYHFDNYWKPMLERSIFNKVVNKLRKLSLVLEL